VPGVLVVSSRVEICFEKVGSMKMLVDVMRVVIA